MKPGLGAVVMSKLLVLICAPLLALSVVNVSLAQEKDAKPAEKPVAPNPDAKPPAEQPKSGPGGAEYAHKKVESVTGGKGGTKYWLFMPAEPAAKEAPIVMLIHGFGATDPNKSYIEWIEHIVKRGNLVIFPIYQETALEPSDNYAPNCAESLRLAFEYLAADKTRVQPIKEKFAVVGHSAGGMTTGNLTAKWEELKIPKPLAAMPVQPGRAFGYNLQRDQGLINFADFSKIPRETLLLCVYGDSDQTVGSYCALKIFAGASNVPAENKNALEVRSCVHGSPKLIASHQSPGAPRGIVDVLDWNGYWKLFDGLCDAAFYGKNREYALGNTEKQRSLGSYSDGCKICEMQVTLGDAKIDPDTAEYTPAYDRKGNPVAKSRAEEKKPAAPEPAPQTPRDRREERKEERRKEEKAPEEDGNEQEF